MYAAMISCSLAQIVGNWVFCPSFLVSLSSLQEYSLNRYYRLRSGPSFDFAVASWYPLWLFLAYAVFIILSSTPGFVGFKSRMLLASRRL